MHINHVKLRMEMAKGLNRSVYPKVKNRVEAHFRRSKGELVRSFENAPPSKELSEVAALDRESRLDVASSYVDGGNLYGFMGFQDDRNPVQEVKTILEEEVALVTISKGAVNQQGQYVVTGRVEIPTLEQINNRSPVGFSSRGWIDALTKGLRGLPNFLLPRTQKQKDKSRSGAGLQVKVNTGRGAFRPYSGNFLSEFLERFKRKIRGR